MFQEPFTHSGVMIRLRIRNHDRVAYLDSDRPGILIDIV